MSKPKLYLCDVFMMARAERSIVKSKPELTMSFSEAPFIQWQSLELDV